MHRLRRRLRAQFGRRPVLGLPALENQRLQRDSDQQSVQE